MPFTLTPEQLTTLRESVQSRSPNGTPRLGVPFIVWCASDRVWVLHAYGRTMAESADPTLLCHALAIEREHPGWLSRVCDPTLDPSAPVIALDTPGVVYDKLSARRVIAGGKAPADISIDDLF